VTLLRLHYTTHKATQIVRSSTGVSQAVTLLTAIPRWKYAIPSDLASQATLGRVSTWIGDGLGIPGAVSNDFFANFQGAQITFTTACNYRGEHAHSIDSKFCDRGNFYCLLGCKFDWTGGGEMGADFRSPYPECPSLAAVADSMHVLRPRQLFGLLGCKFGWRVGGWAPIFDDPLP
jgi:hypothetical protein